MDRVESGTTLSRRRGGSIEASQLQAAIASAGIGIVAAIATLSCCFGRPSPGPAVGSGSGPAFEASPPASARPAFAGAPARALGASLPPSAADTEPGVPAVRAARPPAARQLDVPPPVWPELTRAEQWPSEPPAPPEVDPKRFADALVQLCGPHADRHVHDEYAPALLRAAAELGNDPFLLGALMSRRSGCASARAGDGGLTGIAPELLRSDLDGAVHRYVVFDGAGWRVQSRSLARFPLDRASLRTPESNFYFAAALLRALSEQARGLRAAFAQPVEYRHFVSHYVWGDLVRSRRDEDWILVERRRLLEYYGSLQPSAAVRFRGFELGCPLDGCPRVVTSTLGDPRDQGRRLHRGNDFESSRGEPVRAVAAGIVSFAGLDLPGRGAAAKIPIWAQRNIDPEGMGAGGLYVCLDHGTSAEGEGLVSCYMHLEAATVVQGRRVERGEQVGRVGTSGIKQSKPHLHFELHGSDGALRASDALSGLAIGEPVRRASVVTRSRPFEVVPLPIAWSDDE